ncbi:MAG: TIGR03086 family protein [Chloroflexi bacterium]|nr:MAG: TIGR03086 family protein [Chloroflexota bacterium]
MLERTFQAPIGLVPGAVLLHLRITELLVHGWDLAHATGQPARLPDDLAEEELAFARSPRAPDVPLTGHPFGPAQSIPDDAAAIDRLAAYLGRPIPTDYAEADRA